MHMVEQPELEPYIQDHQNKQLNNTSHIKSIVKNQQAQDHIFVPKPISVLKQQLQRNKIKDNTKTNNKFQLVDSTTKRQSQQISQKLKDGCIKYTHQCLVQWLKKREINRHNQYISQKDIMNKDNLQQNKNNIKELSQQNIQNNQESQKSIKNTATFHPESNKSKQKHIISQDYPPIPKYLSQKACYIYYQYHIANNGLIYYYPRYSLTANTNKHNVYYHQNNNNMSTMNKRVYRKIQDLLEDGENIIYVVNQQQYIKSRQHKEQKLTKQMNIKNDINTDEYKNNDQKINKIPNNSKIKNRQMSNTQYIKI